MMERKFIRKLQKTGDYSYVINLPKELIDEFNWRERQKLEIVYNGKETKIIIKDWRNK